MAKIAKLDMNSGYPVAMLQLKDDLVINGQVYEINDLYPRLFKNITFNSTDSDAMSTLLGTTDHTIIPSREDQYGVSSSCWTTRGRRSGNFTYGCNFMVDNSDSNIGWVLLPYNSKDSGVTIFKISLVDKEIISYTVGSSCYTAYFLGQDSESLYFGWLNPASSYVAGVCQSFDKTTMSFGDTSTNSNYRYGQPTYMTEDSAMQWVIFSEAYTTPGHTLHTLDKSSANWSGPTSLQISPNGSISCNSVPSQTRAVDVDNDAAYAVWPTSDTNNVYEIYKYNFNKSGQVVTSTLCTLDFTSAGVTRSDEMSQMVNVNNSDNTIETWMVTGGTSDYVCFSVSEKPNHSTEETATFKVYIFKIETTDTNLTYIGKLGPAVRIRGIMPLEEDWTKIMVLYDGGMKIYDWNSGTETYDYADAFAADVMSVMVDRLERIWVLDSMSELHMFSATTPIRITVTMQNETYNYTGSTINTYANVSAWNVDGDRVAANVKLVLEGSAEFTNGSQSYTFTTSASADTQVNINITGSSYSRAVASVVV